jgi:hypothetical protein
LFSYQKNPSPAPTIKTMTAKRLATAMRTIRFRRRDR